MGHNWSKAPQIVLFEYRLQQCKDNDDLSQFNSTCLGSVEARRRLKLYQFDFTKESKLDPTQLFIRAATNQQCFWIWWWLPTLTPRHTLNSANNSKRPSCRPAPKIVKESLRASSPPFFAVPPMMMKVGRRHWTTEEISIKNYWHKYRSRWITTIWCKEIQQLLSFVQSQWFEAIVLNQ